MCRLGRHTRPRSADLGGLYLATGGSGQGYGWLSYSCELETEYAELLSDMYNELMNAVNDRHAEYAPTDLPPETQARLIDSLDSWNFEPHKLPHEEVLTCTIMLFEALFRIEGMREAAGVDIEQITPLICHLRQIYRRENSYHNFEHALDVLQATYAFLKSANMVPSVKILLEPGTPTWSSPRQFDSGPLMTALGLRELFAIYIAAIGHDVGHPGFSNGFMKNASTPLYLVFSGKSALEQMHCSLLLRVMRHHGLSPFLDDPDYGSHIRKFIYHTVMATDMSVHGEFMERFSKIVNEGELSSLCDRQGAIAQAIIKCADISNPSRPYHVSQHWASALVGEWMSQANLEKYLDLPSTVMQSSDSLSEARSQVFFINTFAKPLMELAAVGVPEMQPYLSQCTSNLHRWQAKVEQLEAAQSSTDTPLTPNARPHDDYLSAFPLTLALHHRMSLMRMTTGQASSQLWPSVSSSSTTTAYPRPRSGSSSSSHYYSASSASSSADSFYSCPPSSCSEASFMFSPQGEAEESVSSGDMSEPPTAKIDPHYTIRVAAGKAGKRSQGYFLPDLSEENFGRVKRNSWCVASMTRREDHGATFTMTTATATTLGGGTPVPPPPSAPIATLSKTIVVATPKPKPRLGVGVGTFIGPLR